MEGSTMQYTCQSCRDISERKLLRKEMVCARCGGEIVADPQQMTKVNKQIMLVLVVMAIIAICVIVYG